MQGGPAQYWAEGDWTTEERVWAKTWARRILAPAAGVLTVDATTMETVAVEAVTPLEPEPPPEQSVPQQEPDDPD